MESLNYHHLRYFWATAREGSVTRASERLHVSQPAVSAQIRTLEHVLGEKLFSRSGRSLTLTEAGRVVYRYAEEIFGLGTELMEALEGRVGARKPLRFAVGIADVLPKTIVRRLLEPAFHLAVSVQLVCHEDKTVEEFLAELAIHEVDLVLADAPAPPGIPVRAFSHRLGECGTTVFGAPALARHWRKGFPRSLAGAPFLMPGLRSALRRALEQWLDTQAIRPNLVAEVDDTALVNALGQDAKGLFVGPSVMEKEICRQHGVQVVGRLRDVRQQFYAISVERRLKHPAVVAISEAARHHLFVPMQSVIAPGGAHGKHHDPEAR
jgi:LysR family transcriptional regulator, transcriptional activator of nhaA